MPRAWDEGTETELSCALAEYRGTAADMLGRAHDLETRLPGTRAAFRSGVIGLYKASIMCGGTEVLDPGEARKAEAMVLGRAGRLTPAGLRSAIAAAVMDIAPDKARRRREKAARKARVERRPEFSGNASLSGRELPPAKVLAADQRINWWAGQLKDAGVEGSADELRAKAYLDLLLDIDSRPAAHAAGGTGDGADPDDDSGGPFGLGSPDPFGPRTPPGAGVIPAGFIGRNHLTVPLSNLVDRAARPGEIPGIGPVDPDLARDLARATASNPKTTWCLTVTDQDGHAIGHGCARPEPQNQRRRTTTRQKQQPPDGRDPPDPPAGNSRDGGTGPPAGTSRDGPVFTFTPTGRDGPPGGYGSWRFSTGVPGQPDLIIEIDPIATDTCEHRFEAAGHNPGVKLRHLTEVRHATCTGPTCRRPSTRCDFEHNTPYEAGGRTCECNGGPKCRHEHRLKQDPRWKVEQLTPATFRWTTPSGRQYTTEPTRYPI
jgi:hypothetical protein